jgi:cytochrome P450
MGSRYTIVLNGKKSVHEALVKRSLDFADRPNFYTNTTVLNKHSKGIIDHHYNPEFRRQHQLALSILKEFGFGKDIMEDRIQTEVSSLIKVIRDLDGRPFWPDSTLTSHVLNVIVSILFGYHMEQGPLEELISTIHGFIHGITDTIPVDSLPALRFLPSFHRSVKNMLEFNRRLFAIVDNGIKMSDVDSFVQRYVELENDRLDHEQLRYIVRDLMLAGTETSASTLLWALGELAQPVGKRIQARMQAEIDGRVPRDKLPSLSDRQHLPYVEATILELMRLRTVVPLALTHVTCCDTSIDGYFIPAGTMVLPNLYSVHMDPEVWENPDQFQPERFLDKSRKKIIGKERIIPFSIGRRSCLGELLAQQEIFLFLTAIIQNFTVEPPPGCDSFQLREKISITIAPDKYEVCLIPRL